MREHPRPQPAANPVSYIAETWRHGANYRADPAMISDADAVPGTGSSDALPESRPALRNAITKRHREKLDSHGFPTGRMSLLAAAGMTASAQLPAPQDVSHAQGLPLPAPADSSRRKQTYFATTVNNRGRIAERTPLRLLGWGPRTPLALTVACGAGAIVVRPQGPTAVTSQGFLQLPPEVRHVCRLQPGDRLLLVAHVAEQLLVAYSPQAVDRMLTAYNLTIADMALP